ncbi:MAG TPA: hypothetical protein VK210_14960 [Terriglobia bacterium]|nr:hypothetical protein [Terriglobia bacterium]
MKTDVYSWRVTSAKKIALENRARREGSSLAQLLDRITQEWMDARNSEIDPDEQIRLHAAVGKTLGVISGKNPVRAEQARTAIRKKLANRYGR